MSYEIKFLQNEVSSLKMELKELKKMLAEYLGKQQQSEVFYSIQQVAKMLNSSDRTVRRMIDANELIVINRNNNESGTKKLIRIPASSVQNWAKANQVSIN